MAANTAVNQHNEHDEFNQIADEELGVQMDTAVFMPYRCHSLANEIEAQPHPGNVVEAASLAAQMLPPSTYEIKPALPDYVITDCKLSNLQLEGIVHACQRHQMVLPYGARAGFFLGDAAGIGKGRQIAGILINNYVRGRRKHLWFSTSHDLRIDAERDLKDLNCYIKVIDGCQELDRETRVTGLSSDVKDGILFNTYSTLVSQGHNSRANRLEQLLTWCGTNFDGCLIFDECHKAKYFVPGNESASTKAAASVITLQRRLPKARVVYCSATGVTDVKNMAFMERLGLWGENTAFRCFEKFLQAMTTRGLGASEMLAIEMKAAGMYVSRSLSFETAEFHTVEICLTNEQIKTYNLAVRVWQQLAEATKKAMELTKCSNFRLWATYWSYHQRFFKQLCICCKIPAIVREAKCALAHGHCVVIGLQTTGEASLENEITRQGGSINNFVSTTKEILSRFIIEHFPTKEKTTHGPKVNEWCTGAATALLEFLDGINLPISPLDELIQQLGGPDCVAEMTGRRGRIVCTKDSSTPTYQLRDTESIGEHSLESLNVREKNLFMQGKKFVAVISDAASTGISLHCDARVANDRRRVHITLELPWSAEKAVQQLGRSHRSNQRSAPIYKLMTTNIGGERRFVAAVAQRLQSLGALTRGDRRAATGANLSKFNYNTKYGRIALKSMYSYICSCQIFPSVSLSKVFKAASLDETSNTAVTFNVCMKQCLIDMGLIKSISARSVEKDTTDVHKFLNRILGISIERQNLIFSYFDECLTATIAKAKKDGKYNEGVTDIKGTSIVMIDSPKEIFTEVKRGNVSTKHIVLRVDRGINWSTALKMYRDASSSNSLNGFYCSRYAFYGRHFCLLAICDEQLGLIFTVFRPNTGRSSQLLGKNDLLQKYDKMAIREAEKHWKEFYGNTEWSCIHGIYCKNGPYCKTGSRLNRLHILCGGIISMLSLLESILTNCTKKYNLSKEEQTLRIVRVQLDDGSKIVGLRYPEVLIDEVATVLKWSIQQKLIKKKGIISLVPNSGTQLPSLFQEGNSYGMAESVMLTVAGSGARLTVEKDTQVSSQMLKRAFTKPLSIKTFFNKVCRDSETPVGSEWQQQTKFNKEIESNDDDAVVIYDHDGSKSERSNSVKQNSSTSGGKARIGVKRFCTNKENVVSTSCNKKHKQLKVADAFQSTNNKAKMKDNDSEQCLTGASSDDSLLIYCPICSHSFAPNTDNKIINGHLDRCLDKS